VAGLQGIEHGAELDGGGRHAVTSATSAR